MKTDRIISVLKYMIVCLAFIYMDKADEFHSAAFIEDADKSEFTVPAEKHFHADNFAFSAPETQCRVPRQTSVTNTVRTITQASRNHSTTNSRNGFTLIKAGKSMNDYTTSLFFISKLNFPSGMDEADHHLISLGKLII